MNVHGDIVNERGDLNPNELLEDADRYKHSGSSGWLLDPWLLLTGDDNKKRIHCCKKTIRRRKNFNGWQYWTLYNVDVSTDVKRGHKEWFCKSFSIITENWIYWIWTK